MGNMTINFKPIWDKFKWLILSSILGLFLSGYYFTADAIKFYIEAQDNKKTDARVALYFQVDSNVEKLLQNEKFVRMIVASPYVKAHTDKIGIEILAKAVDVVE